MLEFFESKAVRTLTPVTKYQIISGTEQDLAFRVEMALKAGWELQGGVSSHTFASGGTQFAQAMIRHTYTEA